MYRKKNDYCIKYYKTVGTYLIILNSKNEYSTYNENTSTPNALPR